MATGVGSGGQTGMVERRRADGKIVWDSWNSGLFGDLVFAKWNV